MGGNKDQSLGPEGQCQLEPEGLRRAQAAHAAAGHVLARLVRDRVLTEARLAETGRRDPLKQLTGASALDRAVITTQSIIERLELLLLETNEPAARPHRRGSRAGSASALVGASRK